MNPFGATTFLEGARALNAVQPKTLFHSALQDDCLLEVIHRPSPMVLVNKTLNFIAQGSDQFFLRGQLRMSSKMLLVETTDV